MGAAAEQSEFVREDQAVLLNGREFKDPPRQRRPAFVEISFRDLGADSNTSATFQAAAPVAGIEADPVTACGFGPPPGGSGSPPCRRSAATARSTGYQRGVDAPVDGGDVS